MAKIPFLSGEEILKILCSDYLQSENDNLFARSQAKRLTAGLEKFKKVVLDFSDIHMIGQGFADEVFRVFQNDHPGIQIIPTHANENVMQMILHVLNRK